MVHNVRPHSLAYTHHGIFMVKSAAKATHHVYCSRGLHSRSTQAIAKFQNTIIVNRIYGILNYFSHHWSLFLITVEIVIWFNNINEYQLEPEWRIILIHFVLDWQKQEDQAAKDNFSYKFKTSLVNKRLCHLGKRMTEEKLKGGLGEEQEEISTKQNLGKKESIP